VREYKKRMSERERERFLGKRTAVKACSIGLPSPDPEINPLPLLYISKNNFIL